MTGLLSLLNLLAGLVALFACWFVWQRRQREGAVPLAALSLLAALWALCYAAELATPTLNGKIFWLSAKTVTMALMPVALASFVIHFAGWHNWPGRSSLSILLIIPLITAAVVATNPTTHLFWSEITLRQHPAYQALHVRYGPWYVVHAAYSYGLILAAVSIAFPSLMRHWQAYRRQILLVSGGLAFSLAANIAYVAGWQPLPDIDLTPICMGLSTIFLLLTTEASGILDVVPLAYALLAEQLADGLAVLDTRGRLVDLNRAAEALLNMERRQLIGRHINQVDHPALQALRQTPGSQTTPREFQIEGEHGPRWYELRLSPVYGNGRKPVGQMILWHDITRRKRVETQLRLASTHDHLTGLHNRLFFEEEFGRIREGGIWPVAVLIGDLDNLKDTNDRLGHRAGDELLQHTAQVLRSCVRSGDLVARIGGDEFAVVLVGCDQAGASALLRRLSEAFAEHNRLHPNLPIEISLGMAIAREPAGLEQAFQSADARMYADKEKRKG